MRLHVATAPPKLAVFISGHGYGHLTRTSAILTALLERAPVTLAVMTSAPRDLWPAHLSAVTTSWHELACDVGVAQPDDFRVDQAATRRKVAGWRESYSRAIRQTSDLLSADGGFDLVIGDVPALAFDVAESLGVASIAVANFSWDWIYDRLEMFDAAEDTRRAYAKASLLLELTPASPMLAFRRRATVGVVGRRAASPRATTRERFGITVGERLVLLAFRPGSLGQIELPPPCRGVSFASSPGFADHRSDVRSVPAGVDFLDMIAAADVVVAKAGYGIIGDCVTNETRLLWTRRSGFPEDETNAAWLQRQPWATEVARDALIGGSWHADLARALSLGRPASRSSDEAVPANAAARIIERFIR